MAFDLLAPALVALFFGVLFVVRRKSVAQTILDAHVAFWAGTLKLTKEQPGRFSNWFVHTTVLVLGGGLVLVGFALLLRFLAGGAQ